MIHAGHSIGGRRIRVGWSPESSCRMAFTDRQLHCIVRRFFPAAVQSGANPPHRQQREHLFNFMSEPLRIVSVNNEDENTPDFVSRVRVGVRLCDLSERISSADDWPELS